MKCLDHKLAVVDSLTKTHLFLQGAGFFFVMGMFGCND